MLGQEITVGKDTPARSSLVRLADDGHSTPWAWTPDGEHLLVRRPGQIVDRQQLSELWLVSPVDGSERRLAENALHPTVHQGEVAYLSYQAPGEWQAVVADLASGATLHARLALWNAPPRWVDGQAWSLAPSGRWTSVEGQTRSLDLPALAQPGRTRLSPDGSRAAATDGRTLWVSSRGDAQVLARASQVYGFSWSPHGTRLAYVTANGGPQPELWIWEVETEQARLLLRGELEHLGEPAWSPDERTLALVRTPTGSGTAGDIWLVEVDAPHGAHPLARTEADERAPCWSPDGRRLAFAADGALYVADLDALPPSPADLRSVPRGGGDGSLPRDLYGGGLGRGPAEAEDAPPQSPPYSPQGGGGRGLEPLGRDAPETILVLHDAQGNTCRDVPDGQIDEIPFEQYVKQVIPNEVYASWPTETLKTQAVAARTYAWVKWLYQGDRAFTVRDSTRDQYMCDTTHPNTNRAVEATLGQYVAYEGDVIWAFYSAEAGHLTNYRQLWATEPYLRPVADPPGLGKTRYGHGSGMSQWGAYRWAKAYGWTYQQILAHYYTGATVEPSNERVWPLAAVVWPQSNSFITRDTADLRAIAGSAKTTWPDSGVLSVTLSARFTDTWTLIYTDTNAADGWGTLWPVDAFSDTITPSIALRATAYDLVGWRQESELSYVGINRSPPTGTLELAIPPSQTLGTSASEVTTLTLPLSATASDPSPTLYPLRVSLGTEDRVWEEREMTAPVGGYVDDPAAWDGRAWRVAADRPGALVSSAGYRMPAEAPSSIYRLWVRLRVPAGTLAMTDEIARLAALNANGELLGVRYLRGTDLQATNGYQELGVDLVAQAGEEVWWRIDVFGPSALWVDRLSLASTPLELPSDSRQQPLNWTMPPGEGLRTVVARYVDGAENVSPLVPMTVTVVDLDPPAGWRNLHCAGLSCNVEVHDVIAGLDTESGAVRASFDGGSTWSAWLPVTSTGSMGSFQWETLYLPGLDPEMGGAEAAMDCDALLQFRVRDVAAASNEGRSPLYTADRCHHSYLPLVLDSAVLDFPVP